MKYLPLIWSAVMRKPTRTILTLLSVTVAFTLFGLMIGLNATFDMVAEKARADRIFTGPRFGGLTGMPIAVARQIASMPGVKVVTAVNFVPGYVQDPKNPAFLVMLDDNAEKVVDDWSIAPEVWAAIRKDRTGIVSALTLSLLGVDDDTIADDYTLSEAAEESAWAYWGRIKPGAVRPRHIVVSPREAMLVFLTELRERHGTVADYAASLGVTDRHVASMRDHLLD